MKTDLHTFVVEEKHQLPGIGHPLVDEQKLLGGQTYAGLPLNRGEVIIIQQIRSLTCILRVWQ